jgi:pyridoxamine 5'-phosphate oxidase
VIKIISNRREYGKTALLEKDILNDPFKQFEAWLQEAIETVPRDVNAMVLATVDERGEPDTRVVLLKEFDSNGLIFFTHYNSPKGMQLEKNKIVALNFYWAELSRQVRVKGRVEKVSKKESETYFASRPRESQIATLASNQSEILSNRDDLYKKI